jgi:choline dehydrogenase
MLNDIVNTIATSGPALDDTNSAANVEAIGVGNPSYTIDEHHNRSCVRDRLLEVQHRSKGKLTFVPDTLATKVALCDPGADRSPTAYGVEIAVGGALAVGSNFKGKQKLNTRLVTVRHEVIVSAGVFQSPQLVNFFAFGIGYRLTRFRLAHGIHVRLYSQAFHSDAVIPALGDRR